MDGRFSALYIKALLIRWDPFLILNLALYILYGIRRLNLKGDCFASERLYEDLHVRIL